MRFLAAARDPGQPLLGHRGQSRDVNLVAGNIATLQDINAVFWL